MKLYKKRLILLTLFSLCFFHLFVKAQFSVGADISLSTSKLTEAGSQWKTGGKIGLSVDYTFKNKFVILSGLECTMKGANSMWGRTNEFLKKEFECNLYYMEIPVLVGYSLKLNDNIKLVPHVGVFFSYGFHGWGEIKTFDLKADQDMYRHYTTEWHPFRSGKNNIPEGGPEETPYVMDRFDFGIRVGMNAQVYHHFVLSASYDLGINNTGLHYGIIGQNGAVCTRTFSVGLGYRF